MGSGGDVVKKVAKAGVCALVGIGALWFPCSQSVGAVPRQGSGEICFTGPQDLPSSDCAAVDVTVGFATKADAISVILTNDSAAPWLGGPLGVTLVVPERAVNLPKPTGSVAGVGYTASWRARNGVVDLRCEFTRSAWPNPEQGNSVSCDLPRLGLAAGEYPAAFVGFREMIPAVGHGGIATPLADPLVIVRGTSRSVTAVVSGSVDASPTSSTSAPTTTASTTTTAAGGPTGAAAGASGATGPSGDSQVAAATTERMVVTEPPTSIDRPPSSTASASTTARPGPTITREEAKARGVKPWIADSSDGGMPWAPIAGGVAVAGVLAAALAARFAKRNGPSPDSGVSAGDG